MAKILVIYHSQQFGDTKALAEALEEGVRETGAKVEIISTNERRVTLDEFLAADGVALGTPDYFSYLAGTIKTFFDDMYLWDKSGESVKGKPVALFFSHGGGGRVVEPFEYLAGKFFEQVGETVESRRPTGDEARKKCRALGKELVEHLTQIVQ
ncbi:MAG: flavodoxin family protein [Desulfobacteraceae bacterium]|nr:MAG: flavodoxin family protein [Desulfobacteraceae bacterium]